MGVPHGNVIMCDRKGVIHKGRSDLDQWKSAHAVDTDARTLAKPWSAPTSSSACRRPAR